MRSKGHTHPSKDHLDRAHRAWRDHLQPGDHVIDATCGNGQDLIALLCEVQPESGLDSNNEQALVHGSTPRPKVFAYDIQARALHNAQYRCQEALSPQQYLSIEWILRCHSDLGANEENHSISLIVYNLGYLPGGDKSLTTRMDTTLRSLYKAEKILRSGGAISVMCYPGHEEGYPEWRAIRQWAMHLPSKLWSICEHRWLNRQRSPVWIWLKKA